MVTKLKVWLCVFFLSSQRTLHCYQEDVHVGLWIRLYQLNCMEIYCYVELYRPMWAISTNLGLESHDMRKKIALYVHF